MFRTSKDIFHLFIIINLGILSTFGSNQNLTDIGIIINSTNDSYEYMYSQEGVPVVVVNFELPTETLIIKEKDTEKQSENDAKVKERKFHSPECSEDCDSSEFDAISPLTVNENLSKLFVYLIKGKCSWIYDIKSLSHESLYGKEHHFMFNNVEAMFSIPLTENEWNITGVFTSGLSAQVMYFNRSVMKSIEKKTNPFSGLTIDFRKPIDSTFIWIETKTVYFIQSKFYFAYDLINNKQFSNYPKNLSDFGLYLNNSEQISASFTLRSKIYFFTKSRFVIYSIHYRNSSNGVFYGELNSFQPIEEFLKCKKKEILSRSLIGSTKKSSNFGGIIEQKVIDKKISVPVVVSCIVLAIILLVIISFLVFMAVKNQRNSKNEETEDFGRDKTIPKAKESPNKSKLTEESHVVSQPELKLNESELPKERIRIYWSGRSVTTKAFVNIPLEI